MYSIERVLGIFMEKRKGKAALFILDEFQTIRFWIGPLNRRRASRFRSCLRIASVSTKERSHNGSRYFSQLPLQGLSQRGTGTDLRRCIGRVSGYDSECASLLVL